MNRTTKVPKGFEISFNEYNHLLTVRAWGVWDKEFAQKCCRMLAEKIRETGGNYRNWSMLIDMEGLNSQTPELECFAEKQIENAQAQLVHKIGILKMPSLFTTNTVFAHHELIRIGEKEEVLTWLTQAETHKNEHDKEPRNAF